MTTIETYRFAVGEVYAARSACDSDAVFLWTVVARTAKFITLAHDGDPDKRVGIKVHNGSEWALPFGSYSMAPVIRAGMDET